MGQGQWEEADGGHMAWPQKTTLGVSGNQRRSLTVARLERSRWPEGASSAVVGERCGGLDVPGQLGQSVLASPVLGAVRAGLYGE